MSAKKILTIKVLLAFSLILIITSCPNEEMRDLVELKVSDPVADIFIINSGAPTASRTVTLNSIVTKEEDSLEMRFRNQSGEWSDWEQYSPTVQWELPFGDGTKTVYAEYRDQGHHVVSMINNIVLNTGAPAGDFYIWGTAISGDQHLFVNSSSVTLCMTISNVQSMRFSNDGGSSWGVWVPYSETYNWILPAGDGEKTVDAEFKTNSGTTTSATNSLNSASPVKLDTTAPTVSSFLINSDDAEANNISSILTYTYTEANSVWVEYKNDGGSWSAKEAGAASPVSKNWTMRAEEGTRTVETRLTDIAGNVSSVYSDDIYLNTAAPPAPTVNSTTPTHSTTPTWTWNDVDGAVSYRYSYDESSWSENVPFTSFTALSDLSENNSHTLYVKAVDSEGRESVSGSFTVYIDTVMPVINNITTSTDNANPIFALEGDTVSIVFNVSDVSATTSEVFLNGSPLTVTSLGGTLYSATYTCTSSTANGPLFVDITATDSAGNISAGGDSSIIFDNIPPVINSFILNNGNTYSCSPFLRASIGATDNQTSSGNLLMEIIGTASTGTIPYASNYNLNAAAGTVTGNFIDEVGNVNSDSDTITMKTSAAEDTRYENQSMPSHLSSAAYDLGSMAADWDIHGGDYAQGDLDGELSGEASLWDEDWYKIDLDIGYNPRLTISSSLLFSTNTTVEIYYDENESIPVSIDSYDVSPDGLTITVYVDWDHGTDGNKTIWIKIYQDSAEYTGENYNLDWNVSIL